MLNRVCVIKTVIIFLVLTICPVFAVEIAGLKYGKLERSSDVTRSFEQFQINPKYNYYYSGWGDIPFAIIGIHRSYELRKAMWKQVDLTAPMLRNWINQMDIVYDGFRPYGSNILDHKGKPIGVWYSSKQWTTIIIEDDNKLAVLAPEPPGFKRGK